MRVKLAIKAICIFSSLSVFQGGNVMARSIEVLTLEELIKDSDVICFGKIREIRHYLFKKKALFIVDEVVKGKVEKEMVEVVYKGGEFRLKQGEEYLFFLKVDDGGYNFFGGISGYFRIIDDSFIYYGREQIDLKELKDQIAHFISGVGP